MASVIYLDTHVVAWLYAGELDRIPGRARALIERSELVISPTVTLELQFLFEIRRSSRPARDVIDVLRRELGLHTCDLPFAAVSEAAASEDWTRDPFDRLIVSQAALRAAPLLTRDALIREHYPRATWDR